MNRHNVFSFLPSHYTLIILQRHNFIQRFLSRNFCENSYLTLLNWDENFRFHPIFWFQRCRTRVGSTPPPPLPPPLGHVTWSSPSITLVLHGDIWWRHYCTVSDERSAKRAASRRYGWQIIVVVDSNPKIERLRCSAEHTRPLLQRVKFSFGWNDDVIPRTHCTDVISCLIMAVSHAPSGPAQCNAFLTEIARVVDEIEHGKFTDSCGTGAIFRVSSWKWGDTLATQEFVKKGAGIACTSCSLSKRNFEENYLRCRWPID